VEIQADLVPVKRFPFLTDRERSAYDFLTAHPQPRMSPGTQAKLFALLAKLFLLCEEPVDEVFL
jgi:hypothetical protein